MNRILTSTRVVLPDGVRPATVGVRDESIAWIGTPDERPSDVAHTELGDLALLPGAIDTHVHINEPGTDWEGFATAGRAAAAGGITTLVDMPLNSLPVTTTVEALNEKRAAAAGTCLVDYGFWGGVIPGNAEEIEPLADAGVLGFKCFMSPSGLDEFPHVSAEDLEAAMPVIAATGLPLLVHAELPAQLRAPEGTDYACHVASRPPAAEVAAIEMLAGLAARLGCAVHIVHVASAGAAAAVARARTGGVNLTAETCPHYLTFAADEIGASACEFKCAPPIREAAHREALWGALADGTLNLVASDHSPCPPGMKHLDSGNVEAAWGGIASLGVSLSAVWTGLRERGGDLGTLARWMSRGPAELAGLDGRKGRIAVGFDADLVVLDPDSAFTVDAAGLQHRHAITPYADRQLYGVVHESLVRGRPVYHRAGPESPAEFATPAAGREVA